MMLKNEIDYKFVNEFRPTPSTASPAAPQHQQYGGAFASELGGCSAPAFKPTGFCFVPTT